MRQFERQSTPSATRHRMEREIQGKIEGWAIGGADAAEILAKLGDEGVHPSSQPSRRTVQRIVQAARIKDRSGPWSLADADAGEAELILPVLRAYLNLTALKSSRSERSWFITKAEARWIARVARAAPDLRAFDVYRIARAYLGRATRLQTTFDLDAMLAFRPWDQSLQRDSKGSAYTMRDVYQKGVAGGTIPPAPAFLMMELAGIPWSMRRAGESELFLRAAFQHDPEAYEEATALRDAEENDG